LGLKGFKGSIFTEREKFTLFINQGFFHLLGGRLKVWGKLKRKGGGTRKKGLVTLLVWITHLGTKALTDFRQIRGFNGYWGDRIREGWRRNYPGGPGRGPF